MNPVHAPELERGLAWFNTDRPLHFARELEGQVVLLDFWTYCCINCMHILPDLEGLERRFAGRPFLVVGVHSAKFTNEAERMNVRAAVQRYGIRHPVVVDDDMRIWRAYGARSWPTRVLVDPAGRIVSQVGGEGYLKELTAVIERLLDEHARAGTLAAAPLSLRSEAAVRSASGLAFPGKVLADRGNAGDGGLGRVFVADTAHHRIVVAGWPDAAGRCRVLAVVGDGRPGRDDGPAARARFRSPQGMALARGRLFVADTENHLIRTVDLESYEVATFAGTGEMSDDRAGGARGTAQGLNSPWDLATEGGRLLVAMAGTHQIWRFELGNGFGRAFAGTGRENLGDGPADRAALAQPSGLALVGDVLYFADSEVSAIRGLDLVEERVFTVIGEGLFDFGDEDGAQGRARFQHPLGVAAWRNTLLVADSYNHKVKRVEPGSRTASTLFGDGTPGTETPQGAPRFVEPGGLSVAGDELLVADTNNHRVVWVDLATGVWRELAFEGLEAPRVEEEAPGAAERVAAVALRAGAALRITLDGGLPADAHLNPEAPLAVRVRLGERTLLQATRLGARLPLTLTLPAAEVAAGEWRVELSFAYCTDGEQSLCVPVRRAWLVAVTVTAQGTETLTLG